MGELQTNLDRIAACLIALTMAAPLCAQSTRDPVSLFAICTGRLSAVMEFQWLMQDPAADDTQRARDAMVDLLEAVLSKHQRSSAMALRVTAKLATANLLHRARFRSLRGDAEWAEKRAAQLIANCTALMIS